MNEEDKHNGVINLPDGKTGKVITLPGGRIFDFPFLMNAAIDRIVVNDDGITVAFLFNTPQKIELENIICPSFMVLRGKILTNTISKEIDKEIYNIYLIEPMEIVALFFGIIRVQTIGVDANCNFVTFVRDEQ